MLDTAHLARALLQGVTTWLIYWHDRRAMSRNVAVATYVVAE